LEACKSGLHLKHVHRVFEVWQHPLTEIAKAYPDPKRRILFLLRLMQRPLRVDSSRDRFPGSLENDKEAIARRGDLMAAVAVEGIA